MKSTRARAEGDERRDDRPGGGPRPHDDRPLGVLDADLGQGPEHADDVGVVGVPAAVRRAGAGC